MSYKWRPCLLLMPALLLATADEAWKDKQIAEWSEADAKQVLSDSPWVKTVTPTLNRSANDGPRRSSGRGQGGGIGVGGVGISLPGIGGMGRRGGIGGPGAGGGYPRGGQTGGADDRGTTSITPSTLTLRWESALPVREAELKSRDTGAPTLDEDHYAIAVYGVPERMAPGISQSQANQLKKQASIKRDGKKDLKPSSVQVLQRDDGPVIVYLFPRNQEIAKDDRRILFDVQIGRLQLAQSFYLEDMVYQGKREL
jgi:hypothetical protein